MKEYLLEVELINPRDQTTYEKSFGPIFGKKACNALFLALVKKRNIIAIKVKEVIKWESKKS